MNNTIETINDLAGQMEGCETVLARLDGEDVDLFASVYGE